MRGQQLECYFPSEPAVLGQIDIAHPARADFRPDFVVAEPCAVFKSHFFNAAVQSMMTASEKGLVLIFEKAGSRASPSERAFQEPQLPMKKRLILPTFRLKTPDYQRASLQPYTKKWHPTVPSCAGKSNMKIWCPERCELIFRAKELD